MKKLQGPTYIFYMYDDKYIAQPPISENFNEVGKPVLKGVESKNNCVLPKLSANSKSII